MSTEKIVEVAQVNWDLFFQPDQWYLTPETVSNGFVPLAASFGAVLIPLITFFIFKGYGQGTKWWQDRKTASWSLSQSNFTLGWILFYVPLALSSWIIWTQDNDWSRALTVYAIHLLVNALFPVSLWYFQDISLALLNLIILLGVAMYTTSQFASKVHFAYVVNIPYLFWLLYLLIEFSYFWYLNEGKDALDVNQMKGGKKKKIVKGMPEAVKAEYRAKLSKEKKD